MHIIDDISKFVVEKVVPVVKDVGVPIAKGVYCCITSTDKKKELIISRVRNMSEEELDELIKKNHPLGFIGVLIYSRETKIQKITDAVNEMDYNEINKIIMNS